jgi:DNA polymerase-3 subunit epsilon
MYAIVDIETTGGHAESNSITEIAIFIHNGQRVTDRFETLVCPGGMIPPYIEAYTGITNEMVEHAPLFEDLAEKIAGMLRGNIFVAHNVNFDYSFVRHQLRQSGYDLNEKKLCTVRLGRKAFPGYRSYSLGNICGALGINITNRHRAAGDALATVELFERILQADQEQGFIAQSLKRDSKEQMLPPNLAREDFNKLPPSPGVYYFHDERGKIIYVGKAKNIKRRVATHFGGNSTRKQKQDFFRHIHSITYQDCATELMALILESVEIRKHWPEYNRAQKTLEFTFGIYDYEDQNGYVRLCIDRVRKHSRALDTFRSMTEALARLQELVDTYRLCPKLCNIQTSRNPCDAKVIGHCNGACDKEESPATYNERVNEALTALTEKESFAIIDKGTSREDYSCILVENGRFYGMGYVPAFTQTTTLEQLKDHVSPLKENFFIRELVKNSSLAAAAKQVVYF